MRARTGYCTSKPVDLLAGTNAEKDLEQRAAASQAGSLTASIALPWFYVAPGVARVHAAMEIVPGALKFEKRGGKLHAEMNLLGLAMAADGGVRARFSDTLKFDFDTEAQVAEWQKRPISYEKDFRIAPGDSTFTVTFGAGDLFGKSEAPLKIGAWSGHEPAVSEIAFSHELRPAADLGLGLIEDRTPLTFDNQQIIPAATRQFHKTDAGYFYFETYGFDPASLQAQIRVTRPNGDPVTNSGLVRLPPPGHGASRLPLESLSPGEWRLEITATDASGKELKRTADFELR